jgi:RNA polymerase sigma-70 factor (ECF subfamily)
MKDTDLLARVAAGDDAALRELFCLHAPWLAARLRTVLPTAADVEDVLQETFLAVWKGAAGYRPDGAVGAWIWGIARRQAALFLRRRGPAALSLLDLDPTSAPEREPNPADRSAGDPADAVLARAEIAEAVAALGPEGSAEREVWRLMYVEDRPVAEVARLMGVPQGTVKSRAHRARQLLRVALGAGPAAERGTR